MRRHRRYNPIDSQADGLRQLSLEADPSRRRDRIVLVAGAKGGVGTTAVALAVARDLAAGSAPTMVASACVGRADLALMAGAGVDAVDRPISLPIDERLVLFRTPFSHEPDAERMISEALGRLPHNGWLVIDAGPGDGTWCEALGRHAGRLLLVTTPDDIARLNAYAVVKRLHTAQALPRPGLLVNHARDARHAERAAETIDDSTRRHLSVGSPLAGWLPTSSGEPSEMKIGKAA